MNPLHKHLVKTASAEAKLSRRHYQNSSGTTNSISSQHLFAGAWKNFHIFLEKPLSAEIEPSL